MSQDVFSFEYHELIILSSRFQHANMVRQKCLDLLDLIAEGKTKQRPPTFEVPERELPCRFNVQPTTWFARDNVFNFILFCRRLGKLTIFSFLVQCDLSQVLKTLGISGLVLEFWSRGCQVVKCGGHNLSPCLE